MSTIREYPFIRSATGFNVAGIYNDRNLHYGEETSKGRDDAHISICKEELFPRRNPIPRMDLDHDLSLFFYVNIIITTMMRISRLLLMSKEMSIN
jgi:hypothetical protein